MINLAKCGVVFNQESHTYTLDGKTLQGVTPIVGWMFPETYGNISQEVLERAAERGSFIHENIELADSLGIVPSQCQEALEYMRLRDEWGLQATANEYLVTDGHDIASSIDIVFDDLSLADIKCTSKIHYDNVRLQLSIYAYLFEQQNAGLKVKRLLVVWLPKEQYGSPSIIPIERLDAEDVKKILASYLAGEDNTKYQTLFGRRDELQLVEQNVVLNIANIERKIADLSEQQKTLRENLRQAMEKHGITKWETDYFKVSLGKDTVTRRFDAKRFQSEHKDMCEDYMKESITKGRFTLTLK